MNRKFAIAALLALLGTTAFADSLRSDKHFLKIEQQTLSTSRQYNVQVFDAETRTQVT